MQYENTIVTSLASELQKELLGDILPYWADTMSDPSGGFYGHVSGDGKVDTKAPKGAILNARILWTFSAAFRLTGNPKYKAVAQRAMTQVIDRFEDKEYGGVYWCLDCYGNPLHEKKQIYAIAFAVYGLSEYYRACGDKMALDAAVRLFLSIEQHSFDDVKNGYFEAFERDWSPISDLRLSDKDANEAKTMNTHLHILEAYTSLYRVWKDGFLAKQLENLIRLFIHYIIGEDGHLKLFFDEDWNSKVNLISYGHEIETSWLLWEAVAVLGDEGLKHEVKPLVEKLAQAASQGWTSDGGMVYEKDCADGNVDGDRHWWVQAEAVVGYFNLWQLFGDHIALEKSVASWKFIATHLLDRTNGEWYWSVKDDGTVNLEDPKAGFWKCPYHNGRMCLEVMERVNMMIGV